VNLTVGTTSWSDECNRVTNKPHTYAYVFQKCSVSTIQDCVMLEFAASTICQRKPGIMDRLLLRIIDN
jgi:hypothetical protein